jgi:hypothetical protein
MNASPAPGGYTRISRARFELPCLNHACDANTRVMSDLFLEGNRDE